LFVELFIETLLHLLYAIINIRCQYFVMFLIKVLFSAPPRLCGELTSCLPG